MCAITVKSSMVTILILVLLLILAYLKDGVVQSILKVKFT